MNGGETHINNGQNHMVNLISCGMPDYHRIHKMHNHFLIAALRKRISFASILAFCTFGIGFWLERFCDHGDVSVCVCTQLHSELNVSLCQMISMMVSQRNRKKCETHRPLTLDVVWKGVKQGRRDNEDVYYE